MRVMIIVAKVVLWIRCDTVDIPAAGIAPVFTTLPHNCGPQTADIPDGTRRQSTLRKLEASAERHTQNSNGMRTDQLLLIASNAVAAVATQPLAVGVGCRGRQGRSQAYGQGAGRLGRQAAREASAKGA